MTEQEEKAWKTIGLDTDRLFATNAQAFANPDFTMIVFRENVNVANADEPSLPPVVLSKNVGSLVLPTHVARELGEILTRVTNPETLAAEKG